MISFGVPAGATMLCQMPRSKPGSVSPTGGISGATRAACAGHAENLDLVVAPKRQATLALSRPSGISPASMPVICVVPPL